MKRSSSWSYFLRSTNLIFTHHHDERPGEISSALLLCRSKTQRSSAFLFETNEETVKKEAQCLAPLYPLSFLFLRHKNLRLCINSPIFLLRSPLYPVPFTYFGLAYIFTSLSVITLSQSMMRRSTTLRSSRILPVQLSFCNSFNASFEKVLDAMPCSSLISFEKCSTSKGMSSRLSLRAGT